MPTSELPAALTPLQRAIYETDQLGLTLRDSIKLVTQRMGYLAPRPSRSRDRKKLRRRGTNAVPVSMRR